MKTVTKLWIAIILLIILVPIGLVLPEYFKAGDAWGEWGIEDVKQLVGYIPLGLEKFSSIWRSPIPDYSFSGWEEKGLLEQSFAYIISAVVGVAVVVVIIIFLSKFLLKDNERKV